MATDRERAAEDLSAKLRLEAKLRPKVRRVMKDLSREVIRAFDGTGGLPDVESLTVAELEPVLREHYDDVARTFSTRIRRELTGDASMTDEEAAAVASALATFFDRRAPEQAGEIARTNAEDAAASVNVAEQERVRLQEEEQRNVGRREVALVVGLVFNRKMLARMVRISSLETQASAEASKMTEVDVLLGEVPAVVRDALSPTPTPAEKVWMSQGDSRVRTPPDSEFDHLRADSQRVPSNQPFEVSGQSLMHPGDTSRGASVGNVAGCRCSAIYDVEAIRSARSSTL